jgi:hypothetical protein
MRGGRPLTLAGYGQTGDVHDDLDGTSLLRPEQDGLDSRSAAGQGFVVWSREIEICEPEDAADNSLALPEREAQNGAERQACHDGEVGELFLATRYAVGLEFHSAIASGVSQRVTSPRAVSARS